jgi:hypothetical protein
MGFRIVDNDPQYFSADGTSLLVGGSITFYASGTSDLLDTFTDATLATPNSNPLLINAQGRTSDIWGNANYRMVVADSLGNIQWTRDSVLGPAVLPTQAGNAGNFLSTDGTNPEWEEIVQVPSMTGQSGKWLTNDGADANWSALPAPPTIPTITPTPDSLVIGSITIQWGSGIFPASGANNTSVNVNFPIPFSASPYFVNVTTLGVTPTAIQGVLIASALSPTISGFSAYADDNFSAVPNSHAIINTVPFTWMAIGPT